MKKWVVFFTFKVLVLTIYSQVKPTVSLSYQDYSGKLVPNANYIGVKVGEYYWMNNNFNTPLGPMPNTKEGIDLIHQRYVMFNFNKPTPDSNDPTYWSYFENQGMTINDAMADFDKYYGQYYAVRPAVTTGIHYGKMRENNILMDSWGLPDNEDVLQLVGMCSNGTLHDVRQYLCFNETDQNTPAVVKIGASKYPYYYWFKNGTAPKINNKYKLNFVPGGSKYDRPYPALQPTENYGKVVWFTSSYGDFVGLNQVLYIPTKRCLFAVHDFVELKYQLLMQSFPVRFCRKLTDKELGYKLYISIEGNKKGIAFPQKMLYMYDWPGKDYPLFRTSEEQILDYVRRGKLSPSEIKIIKLNLNEKPSSGYHELDRGYLRGLYVQYILEGKTSKSISDIVKIAITNPRLWLVRYSGTINLQALDEKTGVALKGGEYMLTYSHGVFEIPKSYVISSDELKLINLPIPNTFTITEITPPDNYERSATPSFVVSFGNEEFDTSKNIVFKNKFKQYKDDVTGVDLVSSSELSIGPNPISDVLNINCENEIKLIEIYNSVGRKLYVDKKVENEKSINMKKLPNGIYVLLLKYGNKEISQKIIKK